MIRSAFLTLTLAAAALTTSIGGQPRQETQQPPEKNRQAAKERRAAREKQKEAAATDAPAPTRDGRPQAKLDGCRPTTGASNQGASNPGTSNVWNSYFEGLIARTDCVAAYSLRDQANLDSIKTGAKGRPDKKRPITYDPDMDASRVTIFAPTSADSQQKIVPLGIDRGSMLLTWDFRFDENFRWRGNGYVARHKTWRIDPGPWLAIKTEYRAARNGRLADLAINVPGKKFLAPETRRKGETLQSNAGTFSFDADTWVRLWIFVEGLDQAKAQVSVWAADEKRDAIQLYDRVALLPPKGGLATFRLEYDTSADQGKNPEQMHSWNRNIVVLQDVPRSDLPALLTRPVGTKARQP
jgi:hypothetical protein